MKHEFCHILKYIFFEPLSRKVFHLIEHDRFILSGLTSRVSLS